MSKKQQNRKKIEKTFEKVRLLTSALPKVRKQFINDDKEAINCISECCANILKGNVPLSTRQKSYLCRHKEKIRTVAKKKVSLKKKKEIIQKGGFPLAAILAPAAAALGGLLFGSRD